MLIEHRGYQVKAQLGSFVFTFASPVDAVLFCVVAQQALLTLPWANVKR